MALDHIARTGVPSTTVLTTVTFGHSVSPPGSEIYPQPTILSRVGSPLARRFGLSLIADGAAHLPLKPNVVPGSHHSAPRPGETTARPCRWATAAVLNSYVAIPEMRSSARAIPILRASKGVRTPCANADRKSVV